MITHRAIWSAIDSLAQRKGLSVSGLARMAGLDPTAFNPSKRVSKDGRERWPSTESIAKMLGSAGESMDNFLSGGGIFEQTDPHQAAVPLLGFAQAGAGGFFDSGGFPAGQGWDEVTIPVGPNSNTYALEVSGESMLPLYRDGDVIIVSPAEQIRRGDRVVLRTNDGEVMAKILHRQTTNVVELHSLNPDHPPRSIPTTDVDWIARILWASQ
ncbi:S24 family peptidase [Maritalea sp.]|uniref:S24 family peptidase n=1 Tax=Maritalea sp. TaxID=2003361 RepID=UPI0039E3DCC0